MFKRTCISSLIFIQEKCSSKRGLEQEGALWKPKELRQMCPTTSHCFLLKEWFLVCIFPHVPLNHFYRSTCKRRQVTQDEVGYLPGIPRSIVYWCCDLYCTCRTFGRGGFLQQDFQVYSCLCMFVLTIEGVQCELSFLTDWHHFFCLFVVLFALFVLFLF